MEVVTITKKSAPVKPNESYIASFLKINSKKINQKDILKTSHQIMNYLECITDRKIARMLYALSLVRISTSTKLSEFLQIKSRDTIVYYSMKAVNIGFIKIKTKKDPDYDSHWEYWFGKVRNTHKDTRFFVATDELLKVIPLYQNFMESLIDSDTKNRLEKHGQVFERFLLSEKGRIHEKDKEAERIALITIGACNRCSKLLTEDHQKAMQCQYIANKLYCSECKDQMYGDGTMSKIMKAHNGKNGRN